MDFGFEGLGTGFSGLDVDVQETAAKKVAKYDRVFSVRPGGGSIFVKPTIVNGVVYFGASDGYIYAVDAGTKNSLWTFKTGGPVVIAVEFNDNMIYAGSYDGYLYAIDALTGKETWRFRTHGKIVCQPLFVDNSVIFSSQDGYFYRLSVDGKEIWRFKTGDYASFSPCHEDGKVFVGSYDHNLYCLDIGTGKELWRFRTGGEVVCLTRPPIKHGIIYVTSMDNYLYAVDTLTAKEIWRFKFGEHGIPNAPTIVGKRLYLGSRDSYVLCVDLNGKEIWRFRAGAVVDGCIVNEGFVYFGSDDYRIYAVDADTGKKVWSFRTGGECYMIPTFYGGKLYFGSADCKLYCLNAINGEPVWSFQTSSTMKSEFAPLYEEYRVEIKHETRIEDAISEDRYRSKAQDTVSLSEYQIKSEYSAEGEYKHKSDYDVNWVLPEDIMEVEGIWTSGLKRIDYGCYGCQKIIFISPAS